MKTKSSTHPTFPRRDLAEGGFFNIRTLLALTLCFSGLALALIAGRDTAVRSVSKPDRYMPVPGADSRDEAARLAELEQYWQDRLTYPTGRFDPAWLRAAAASNNTAAETIVRSGKWNSSCGNSRVTLASSPSEVDWLLPDFRAFCRGSRAGCKTIRFRRRHACHYSGLCRRYACHGRDFAGDTPVGCNDSRRRDF